MKKATKVNSQENSIDIINILLQNSEISQRKLPGKNMDIYILFIRQVTDRIMLADNVIKPLIQYMSNNVTFTIADIFNSVLFMDDVIVDSDEAKIIEYLLEGKSIILSSADKQYIAAYTSKYETRIPSSPELEYSVRGPRDSFIENLDSNISMIRYRLKDPGLKIDKITVGRRTKTTVAVVYINDIINPQYVDNVKKKLQAINIDGVIESGYIQKLISDKPYGIFPQVGILERPDMVSANLLEGKLVLLVEGSVMALVTPKRLVEFLDAPDDHYESIYLNIFTKWIRFLCFIITLTISSFYIEFVGFHPDILPSSYIMILATSRATTPFDARFEATIMEIVGEILREASIRLPSRIGPTIGIVGTIVIGQAAVFAGLVSPLMVIVVAMSTMCSYVSPDPSIMAPARLLKFMLLMLTSIFGIFGLVMGVNFILIMALSVTTLKVPYTSPIAPYHFTDLKNFILSDILSVKKRPEAFDTRDNTR
ncbi:MAG: spore germination protein [Desulfitobacteriaceae bacterium]